jgi:hypothetical protein
VLILIVFGIGTTAAISLMYVGFGFATKTASGLSTLAFFNFGSFAVLLLSVAYRLNKGQIVGADIAICFLSVFINAGVYFAIIKYVSLNYLHYVMFAMFISFGILTGLCAIHRK